MITEIEIYVHRIRQIERDIDNHLYQVHIHNASINFNLQNTFECISVVCARWNMCSTLNISYKFNIKKVILLIEIMRKIS